MAVLSEDKCARWLEREGLHDKFEGRRAIGSEHAFVLGLRGVEMSQDSLPCLEDVLFGGFEPRLKLKIAP